MAILKVARLGHPVIRRQAEPVTEDEIPSREFQSLIADLIETMHEYDGVGIAAPQVHVSKRLAVIEVKQNPRYPEAPEIPLTVLVNPRIVSATKETVGGWEGCLSIPDMRGWVPRPKAVVCEALDGRGQPLRIEASDFFARVLCHECDHLAGVVYLDRMPDLKSLTHLAEFAKFYRQ